MVKRAVNDEEFLQRVRRAVAEAGSQQKLAERLAISPAYLSDILNGHRRPSETFLAKFGYRRHADRGQVGNRIDWGWLRVRIHKRHPPAPWIDRHAILLPERRIRPFPAGAEDVYDDAIGPAQNIHGTFAHLVAGVFEQQP